MEQLELPFENIDGINEGVSLLLTRIAMFPEEFLVPTDANYEGKWAWVLDPLTQRVKYKDAHVLDMLTDEEVNLLYGKWINIHREDFSNKVKSQLLTGNTTR